MPGEHTPSLLCNSRFNLHACERARGWISLSICALASPDLFLRGKAIVAIFRFEAKVIGRSDRAGGRSIVACAAYRSGTRLRDDRYDTFHNYRRRAAGVEYTGIHSPEAAPAWATARGPLWNGIEAQEDRHNRWATAQLARELIPAIPAELDRAQRKAL